MLLLICIKIEGKKKHFEGVKLQIKSPAFADIQQNYRRSEVTVNNDIYNIDIEALFGANNEMSSEQNFRIILAQVPVDGENSAQLKPELINKPWKLKYNHNYANVRTGGR